jgi:hypothetical protein
VTERVIERLMAIVTDERVIERNIGAACRFREETLRFFLGNLYFHTINCYFHTFNFCYFCTIHGVEITLVFFFFFLN